MKTMFKSFLLLVLAVSFAFYSCSDDDNENPFGIPSDNEAGVTPTVTETNTTIPNAQFTTEAGNAVITINLTGVWHPETKDWLDLIGTKKPNQNIWVEVDGKAKAIVVEKASNANKKVAADLVFLVDNSGSMGQEADSVANGIVAWATKLDKQNLDIQFGCVGFNSGVNGALGLSKLSAIDAYLNRPKIKGTSRTVGFAGTDSLNLLTVAKNSYQKGSDECGAEAVRFADANFTFRVGANRIYVNFTDEPNQPGGSEAISVEHYKDQTKWNTSQGTIHTVFSADTTFRVNPLRQEKPWLMSDYTGGTKMFVNQYFSGVSLDQLPVTGAMVNSYIIRFIDNSQVADGVHRVKIVIVSTDGKVKAEKVFENVKFGK